jgi:hypothetical protein
LLQEVPPFIPSLHRPFNQNLKTSRWVCIFISHRKQSLKSSELNFEFYLYMLKMLRAEYSKNLEITKTGLPSFQAINDVSLNLAKVSKKQQFGIIQDILKKERAEGVEMQIYSTYKAASYFVNMAKDKLGLLDSNNKLSMFGINLLKLKSGLFELTKNEKVFYFTQLIKVDFLMLITLCLFKRLTRVYKVKEDINLQYYFLDKYYHIRDFNFKRSSLGNFNTVRSSWIESLDILDNRQNIRPSYKQIILEDEITKLWYESLIVKFKLFEDEHYASFTTYTNHKKKLESRYFALEKAGKIDLGYVNLYDIKEVFRISNENFESFLNKYYEMEKGKKNIFFSNIVNSIDKRKRFFVRGIPVLKIKIKDAHEYK